MALRSIPWLALALLTLAVIPIGHLTLVLWSHVPPEICEVIGVAYALRLLPATAPLLALVGVAVAAVGHRPEPVDRRGF